MSKKNILLSLPFITASTSIALFTQMYEVYIYRDFGTLVLRLAVCIPSGITAGFLLAFLVHTVVSLSFLNTDLRDKLYRRFRYAHYIFASLNLYALHFIIQSMFFDRILLAATILLYLLTVTILVIFPGIKNRFSGLGQESGKILLSPMGMITFLLLYGITWHGLIAYFYLRMNESRALIREPMVLVYFYYMIASIVTVLLLAVIPVIKNSLSRKILYGVFFFCMIVSLGIRSADLGTFVFSGAHIDDLFWEHLFFRESFIFLLSPFAFIMYGVIAFLTFLFIRQFRKVQNLSGSLVRLGNKSGTSPLRMAGLSAFLSLLFHVLIFSAVSSVLLFTDEPFKKKYDASVYTSIPEPVIITSFTDYYFPDLTRIEVHLDEPLVKKLAGTGIVLNSMTDEYPLMKKSIYIDNVNHGKTGPVIPAKTNVIIVFSESLSKYFTTESMHHQKGLTPYLDDMKTSSCTFDNMYNIIAPTITGMIATLGSFPCYTVRYNASQHNSLTDKRFMFLPGILKNNGYECIHIQGSSSEFASTESVLLNNGFSKIISLENPEFRSFAKEPISGWGIKDHDLFRYTVNLLENNRIESPFFLTLGTIDLHAPFKTKDSMHRFSDPVFDCVHSTDDAFGILWNYFKNSKYRDNTLFLFIADHAMVMNPEYFRLRGSGFNQSRLDTITCVMYIPGNTAWQGKSDPILCTNLDIAPTILDMMKIDLENPFMGLSVFAERERYPYVPCEFIIDQIFLGMLKGNRKINLTTDEYGLFRAYVYALSYNNKIIPPESRK